MEPQAQAEDEEVKGEAEVVEAHAETTATENDQAGADETKTQVA